MLLDMRRQSAWPNVFQQTGGTGADKTATIAVTEPVDTCAAFGVHGSGAGGFVAVTESVDTASISGTGDTPGAINVTESLDTCVATGIAEIDLTSTGTLGVTENVDTASINGRAGNLWANIDNASSPTWTDETADTTQWADNAAGGDGLGDAWETSTVLGTDNIRSIWYDPTDDLWVCCGDNGVIYTRQGLGEWVARTSGVSTSLRTVKKWNGYYWVCGYGTTLLRSADGITWENYTSSIPYTFVNAYTFVSMAFSNDYMFITGWANNGFIDRPCIAQIDTNSSITVRIDSTPSSGWYWYGVTYNPNVDLFVVVGEYNGNLPILYTFENNLSAVPTYYNDVQNPRPSFVTSIWSIDWNGTYYVAGTGAGQVKYSTDLEDWSTASAPDIAGDNIWRITNNDQGDVIICGGYWNGKILRSADNGQTFSLVYENFDGYLMSKAVYGPGFWLAVGWNGQTAQSINSQPWSDVS